MTGAELNIKTQNDPPQLDCQLRNDSSLDHREDLRMNSEIPKPDFAPSPPTCPGLEYLDLPSQSDMRYSQDSSTSSLTIESQAQPTPVLNLYPPGHPSVFNPAPAYPPDSGSSFYAPASNLFPHIDVRSRLASNTSTGMAHALRSTALPPPGTHITTRDLYTPATPNFRRSGEHVPSRSPSFPVLRRHPISPTPSPNLGFTAPPGNISMAAAYSSKTQTTVPPLQPMTMHGTLSYPDSPNTLVKPDINGVIDKGFFQAEGEWTCYRRNYFSCICSYWISPPQYGHASLTFTPNSASQSYPVSGFAMCISAVVADNDNHTIELVQHTPKRDKGPIVSPEKVRLAPKPPQTNHHPLGTFSQADLALAGSSRGYEQAPYGQPHQGSFPSEHTFERIQFKQATANNGKRRAAQQYYHLVVELYAEIAQAGPGGDQWLKVAHRKSAKMIVRGRSPGHYQSERRASTSSGPGGSAGGMGGYGGSQVLGTDYAGPGSQILGGGYGGTAYDARAAHYGRTHDHFHMDPPMSADESKGLNETKGYQYFPDTIIEGNNNDPRHPVEMYNHTRTHDHTLRHGTSSLDPTSKMKSEYEGGGLPSLFYPGASFYDRGACGRFEGKSSSSGYYPTMMPPPSLNMT